jgi:hypothetical protein
MVYHWMYIWYIRGISWYIHGYSKLSETRFRGRPVLLVSFNVHTREGDQECFIPRATMAIAPGDKAAHKRLNPTAANVPRLSLVAAVTAAAAAVSQASFRVHFPCLGGGDGSGGGSVAGVFPFSLSCSGQRLESW